jgi:hypothetical protein
VKAVAIYESAKADFELLKEKIAQDRRSRSARRNAAVAKGLIEALMAG